VKLISGFAKQLLFTANSELVPKLFENETTTIINFHDKRKPGRPHIQLKLDALSRTQTGCHRSSTCGEGTTSDVISYQKIGNYIANTVKPQIQT